MTGDEMLEGGLDRTAAQEIARRLDELGILDYFNVVGASCETYGTEALTVPDMSFPPGLFSGLAASIKSRGRSSGHRRRAHQRPGAGGAGAEGRTGRPLRHDPRAHRRPGPAEEGSRRPTRRHSPLLRLQHRAASIASTPARGSPAYRTPSSGESANGRSFRGRSGP